MKFQMPVSIEKLDEQTEKWIPYIPLLRANVNKNSKNSVYLTAGAMVTKRELVFETRYQPLLEALATENQLYRIVYKGVRYSVVDYDDYAEKHQVVKLLGVLI